MQQPKRRPPALNGKLSQICSLIKRLGWDGETDICLVCKASPPTQRSNRCFPSTPNMCCAIIWRRLLFRSQSWAIILKSKPCSNCCKRPLTNKCNLITMPTCPPTGLPTLKLAVVPKSKSAFWPFFTLTGIRLSPCLKPNYRKQTPNGVLG